MKPVRVTVKDGDYIMDVFRLSSLNPSSIVASVSVVGSVEILSGLVPMEAEYFKAAVLGQSIELVSHGCKTIRKS